MEHQQQKTELFTQGGAVLGFIAYIVLALILIAVFV